MLEAGYSRTPISETKSPAVTSIPANYSLLESKGDGIQVGKTSALQNPMGGEIGGDKEENAGAFWQKCTKSPWAVLSEEGCGRTPISAAKSPAVT